MQESVVKRGFDLGSWDFMILDINMRKSTENGPCCFTKIGALKARLHQHDQGDESELVCHRQLANMPTSWSAEIGAIV